MVLIDAHCHFFTDAQLNAGNFSGHHAGTRPSEYTLREHLDSLIAAGAKRDEDIVVVNSAVSILPTSENVLDSFTEIIRLQTLYGARYNKVRVLGTCRADEPKVLSLLKENPQIIGARVFLKEFSPVDVPTRLKHLKPVIDLLGEDGSKYLQLWATNIDTLIAFVSQVPANVPLMIDHLGAWGAPDMTAYGQLLALLAARTAPVLVKGPGHRTSLEAPVTARYAAAAVATLGADSVLLSATDAPHLGATNAAQNGFKTLGYVPWARDLVHRVQSEVRVLTPDEPAAGYTRAAKEKILKFVHSGLPAAPKGMIHARGPTWYTGEDLFISVKSMEPPEGYTSFGWSDGADEEEMHAMFCRPVAASSVCKPASGSKRKDGGLVCIISSGYTGFMGLYPILMAQELTRRGITCIALDYPGYGRSQSDRKEEEVSIGAQARAWYCAAKYARQVLGFTTVVGVAWAMGSPSLLQSSLMPLNNSDDSAAAAGAPAKKQKTSTTGSSSSSAGGEPVYDGIAMLNAILNADVVHSSVIKSVNENRVALQKRIDDNPSISKDVTLPPPSLTEFKAHVDSMDPTTLYPAFEGYPLDAKTLDVVINQLYSHGSYQVPRVRGAFWKELQSVNFDGTKLHPQTRALLVHGDSNELHDPTNTAGFIKTNESQVMGGAVQLLPGGKHNDFMHFGAPNFDDMARHISNFAVSVVPTHND
mmetsp:Transcript_24961/g.41600  ORF Transcript_24961/g.41600 Transcript_24961/m.41600 type:complete len:702 (-) Transcript_24961:248-2353(-)